MTRYWPATTQRLGSPSLHLSKEDHNTLSDREAILYAVGGFPHHFLPFFVHGRGRQAMLFLHQPDFTQAICKNCHHDNITALLSGAEAVDTAL